MMSMVMHRHIEHIAAELLICRSPASICNYILVQFLRRFSTQKCLLLGLRLRPQWGSLQRSPTPPSWVPLPHPPRGSPAYYFAPPLPHHHWCSPPPPPFPIPRSTTDFGPPPPPPFPIKPTHSNLAVYLNGTGYTVQRTSSGYKGQSIT